MVIDAMVNQVDAEKLRIGQKATVGFDAFPELELPARVYSIGTVAKSRQYRKEYVTEIPVKLKLEQTASQVIPDLSVSADVILEESEEELPVVPLSAVHQGSPQGEDYVYVRSGDSWERRQVELGVRSNTSVAVRSGLRPGEEVALVHPDSVKPRQ
jgi:hypothetical protein